ncbi:MAG TPA: YerC/YecD family TrpR-related protein [Gammaproteobacteria bacterium]|nr:YerC/YecD family TrpR-related protein [Gammaproteobacteria bacterium]
MKAQATHGKSSDYGLYEAINAIKTAKEAKDFFEDLCTPAEIQAMADRWRVVEPLKAGKSYRQIYDETGVSVTTIGRVARFIMSGVGYNLIYNRVKNKGKSK